ncbi:MAG: GDP-mannose 4,6-dehydratase [Candidatus Cloacimonetes bacterium]|nr:GDP-mannose 4,6-dehydratase [Candidatus Cloacimonadota bacterium]
MKSPILVTGAAGFIGFHTSMNLLNRGDTVIGLDCMNHYYDPELKKSRLKILKQHKNFHFLEMDLCDRENLRQAFLNFKIYKVCNLAAQAGVRYSLENPYAYQKSNLEGFLNILECCREFKVENLVYASSSSVYGKNTSYPFAETHNTDQPISLYAASKKANELMAHTYSHLFGLNTTGLRFFTVYGPYGRPDMALFLFTEAILQDRPIQVFNHGDMYRDFTYIEDIVSGVVASLDKNYTCEVFNLGNNKPVKLLYYIECIEKALGKSATMEFLPLQAGDVPKTCANIDHATEKLGYAPKTSIEEGIHQFIRWYREYYGK